MKQERTVRWVLASLACGFLLAACGGKDAATSQAASPAAQAVVERAPAPETTGGFDGQRAYQHVADFVAIGPHSAGTEGDRRTQQYII